MTTQKDVDDLTSLFTNGDAWLRKFGVVDNPVAHNNMILNLRMNFPKAMGVEYYLPKNPEDRRIRVVLYFSFWRLLFCKKDQLIDAVIDLVKEYLHDYDVSVELRRWKGR